MGTTGLHILLSKDLALALMLSFSYQRKTLSCWVKAWFPIDRCLVVFQVLGYHRLLPKEEATWIQLHLYHTDLYHSLIYNRKMETP